MPYIDFESPDDFVSLWYNTNAAFNNVGSFDPNRPTILFFHPTLLDTQWLHHHFTDPRLTTNYNMIAFDMRVCGRSNCRHSGRHDSWVEAADIGRAHHALHLPPLHVIGIETLGCNAAIRFAALFPEICLSLLLCNAPPPTELKESFDAYDEALHSWCYAEDIDSFEKYGVDAVKAMLGPSSKPPDEAEERARADLEVDLITYWELFMPPTRRQRVLEQINVILNRQALSPQVLGSIILPVLLMHGEHNHLSPIKYAQELAASLTHVQGGARLYTLKGAGSSLSIIGNNPTNIANKTIKQFLDMQPRKRSDLIPPEQSLKEYMQTALDRLSGFMKDPSISSRDPTCSLSFCCLSQEVIRMQTESLEHFKKGQLRAFNPLASDGRPIRRYTRNRDQHWFQASADGLSYANMTFSTSRQPADEDTNTERFGINNSGPVSVQQVQEGRIRRAGGFTHTTVDKQVIKGSMAKVVSPTASNLSRMLL